MKFYREITLKDGRKCILRSAESSDAEAFLDYFEKAHGETDFLCTYPDETAHNVEKEEKILEETLGSDGSIEICAFVGGRLVGSAGIDAVRDREKTRHRAEYGVSIIKEFWGLGIGGELTKACIECAKEAGYRQLELDVVSENERAISLYRKFGFVEYGRNPRAFRTRDGRWQELVLMRLEIDP